MEWQNLNETYMFSSHYLTIMQVTASLYSSWHFNPTKRYRLVRLLEKSKNFGLLFSVWNERNLNRLIPTTLQTTQYVKDYSKIADNAMRLDNIQYITYADIRDLTTSNWTGILMDKKIVRSLSILRNPLLLRQHKQLQWKNHFMRYCYFCKKPFTYNCFSKSAPILLVVRQADDTQHTYDVIN